MSKRRNAGEWVWLKPNAGFCGESNRLKVEIQPEDDENSKKYGPEKCILDCGDPNCREWVNVWTEPDPEDNDERHLLCHVSECQMCDEPQK